MLSAQEMVEKLQLQPHPEGGYYRETFRDTQHVSGRSVSTAIYYLLAEGQRSHWHRVDAVETWHWYAGAPLELQIAENGKPAVIHCLSADIAAGYQPQIMVPPHHWQAARSLGAWTLVGCTVAPGFEFSGFEMAPPGWQPVAS
jgi:uncharacterized protein